MEPGWYTLNTGRHVWLQRLHIRRTAYGIMLGKPMQVREDVLGRLRTDAEILFGTVPGIFLHTPPDGPLPEYLFMAEYLSPQPVNESADLSMLVVCWFSDFTTIDDQIIGEQVKPLVWDSIAKDGYW